MGKYLDYKDPLRKHKKHSLYGGIIFILTFIIISIISNDKSLGLVLPLSILSSLIAGSLKEFYDMWKNYKGDIGDIVATTLGAIYCTPIYLITYYLIIK